MLDKKLPKDYLPMNGDPAFVKAAREFLWGPILPEIESRVGSIQSCAGTGALYLAAHFARINLKVPKVYLSSPTWPNYKLIFQDLPIEYYPWEKDCVLNLEGTLSKLNEAPEKSLVVLQACAHNPTGVDPTEEEWKKILDKCIERKLIVLFDFAYMGYASGDTEQDAKIVRDFAKSGNFFFVAFSFSKCLGLYGERIGCLHAVCANQEEANAVRSQFALIARRTWSVPPQNGSHIVATVLNDPELKKEWLEELKAVSSRIINIRKKFVELLEKKSGKSFDFIGKQKGMFALTGLSPEEVEILGKEEGVFIPANGRISIPALNNSNVDFVAQAVANVVAKRK
jgi:aspartate/tyrosine/aromatic aminotransferase